MNILTEADFGKTIILQPSEQVEVRLNENPTTGFRWTWEDSSAGAVLNEMESEFRPGGAGVGSGGQHVFVFKAAGPGVARLLFKNWREWVGESSVRELFEVTVNVAG